MVVNDRTLWQLLGDLKEYGESPQALEASKRHIGMI